MNTSITMHPVTSMRTTPKGSHPTLTFVVPIFALPNRVTFNDNTWSRLPVGRILHKSPLRRPRYNYPFTHAEVHILKSSDGSSPNLQSRKRRNYIEGSAASSDIGGNFEENPVKSTKWSEISFRNVQEELDAIDQYVEDENMSEDDPWPKFLRGAAYEHWGQPKLALAQYNQTNFASGLRQVPEIWERRGYNAFKIGDVLAANVYFDASMKLSNDADGNYLHFLHWFYENFEYYMPKRNGPPAPIQHAICKYCAGRLKDARDILVAQISIEVPDIEHALLWMMATSFRLFPDKGLPPGDVILCNKVLEKDMHWDERMGVLILLYSHAAQGKKEAAAKYCRRITEMCDGDMDRTDITTTIYLALYHDAFTRDTVKRDICLDKICKLPGTSSPNDIENFLYHTAKNRFSTPDSSEFGVSVLLPT